MTSNGGGGLSKVDKNGATKGYVICERPLIVKPLYIKQSAVCIEVEKRKVIG